VVTVNAAAKRALGVVQVHTHQILGKPTIRSNSANVFITFLNGTLPGVTSALAWQVSIRHADTGFIFYAVDNGGQVLKLKAKVAALSGGIFNDRRNATGLGEGDIDRFRNARQTFIFRNLHQWPGES
jgi:hypothetical protein